MNSYNLVLKLKVESVDKLSEADIEDIKDAVNEDFPTVLILNEEDWNEKEISIDTIEVESIEIISEVEEKWEFEDVD